MQGKYTLVAFYGTILGHHRCHDGIFIGTSVNYLER